MRDYRTETRQTVTHVLVAGVVRVDEGRLWESVVIVFIFVLLRLSDLISNLGLGGGLTSAGNVVSVQNSVTFGRVSCECREWDVVCSVTRKHCHCGGELVKC